MSQDTQSRTTNLIEGESQWAIVRRMFARRRTAVWGLRGAFGLVLIAVYAPVLCSGLPLVWKEPGGWVEFPWLRRLFDQNYWTNSIDRLFNMVMVAMTIYFVASLIIRLTVKAIERRQEIRHKFMKALAPLAIVLIVLQQFGLAFLNTSETYLDYRDVHKGYVAKPTTQDDLRKLAATLEAGASGAGGRAAKLEAEVERLAASSKKDDQELAREKRRAATSQRALAKRRTAEAKVMRQRIERLPDHPHGATFLPIHYGHREQLGGEDAGYQGMMSAGDGETHLLGTDKVGRDLFARLIYGTRISLSVGLVAVAIYVTIGTIIGAIAGYAGGRVDLAIMRAIEVIICVPGLFLILTIIALFDVKSIFMIMLAIGFVGWTGIARLVRGEILRERAKDYVTAARSLGFSSSRILFRHILPNAIAPVIVASSFGIVGAILTESTLSFLGLGDSKVPSWGMILNAGREDAQWHMILAPGVAIFITVTLLNLVGDGLRDALDPKLRN